MKPEPPLEMHCDPQGLIQPVAHSWCARNMGLLGVGTLDEPVTFVAADYKEARRIELAMWPGVVVCVWRNEGLTLQEELD